MTQQETEHWQSSLTKWALMVVTISIALAIVATVVAQLPTGPVMSEQMVGTWVAVEDGIDSSIQLHDDKSVRFEGVPSWKGEVVSGSGEWSLVTPDSHPRLILDHGHTSLSLHVSSTLWGIEIVAYRGDPDESSSAVVFRQQ